MVCLVKIKRDVISKEKEKRLSDATEKQRGEE